MKRDLDLVRQLLPVIEERDLFRPGDGAFSGYSDQDVAHHLIITHEAGLIEGRESREICQRMDFVVRRLTWNGHDFLAKARDEGVWK